MTCDIDTLMYWSKIRKYAYNFLQCNELGSEIRIKIWLKTQDPGLDYTMFHVSIEAKVDIFMEKIEHVSINLSNYQTSLLKNIFKITSNLIIRLF